MPAQCSSWLKKVRGSWTKDGEVEDKEKDEQEQKEEEQRRREDGGALAIFQNIYRCYLFRIMNMLEQDLMLDKKYGGGGEGGRGGGG